MKAIRIKPSLCLSAAIALAVAGVGVMISLQAEGTAEVAEGKPTKSARHRLPDAVRSASETMRDLNSADRRGLRDWAGGLDDKELHRLAMSFLQRLEDSTEPEDWEDRGRMREFLAVLFMEWGRRDFAGAEVALRDVAQEILQLAYPTVLAGLSETEPEAALDLLWRDGMSDEARIVATMHLAQRDPEAAWKRVMEGGASLEGLAAAATGPGQIAALIARLETEVPPDEPDDPFVGRRGQLLNQLLLGWARHDFTAAADYFAGGTELPVEGIVTSFTLGIRHPGQMVEYLVSKVSLPEVEAHEGKLLLLTGGLKGALDADPDLALDILLQEDIQPWVPWISDVLVMDGIPGSHRDEQKIWLLQPDGRVLPPSHVMVERQYERLRRIEKDLGHADLAE